MQAGSRMNGCQALFEKRRQMEENEFLERRQAILTAHGFVCVEAASSTRSVNEDFSSK